MLNFALGRFLGWIALVLAGVLLNLYLHPPAVPTPQWHATKYLPQNHRVNMGDLRFTGAADGETPPTADEFLGKYVTKAIANQAVVTAQLLSEVPILKNEDDLYVIYTYLLSGDESYLAKVLGVTDTVQLCAILVQESEDEATPQFTVQSSCLKDAFEVIAVYDGEAKALPSWLALKVKKEQSALLGQFIAADKRFLVITN